MHSRRLLALALASHTLTAFAEPATPVNTPAKPAATQATAAPQKSEAAKPKASTSAQPAKTAEAAKAAPAKATPEPAAKTAPAAAKPEPHKAAATKPAPAQPSAPKAAPAKTEPAKTTAAKPTPAPATKAVPAAAKPVPTQPVATKAAPVKAAPTKAEPAKTAAAKPTPAPAKPVENKAKSAAKAPVSAKSAKSVVKTEPESELAWHVSAGYVWRNLGDLSFSTRAQVRDYRLPSPGKASAIGSAHGKGGHSYEDGFVNADASTASTGETWFWGYERDSQLHGSDLTFHGTTFAQSRYDADHPGWSDDLAGGGPILAFGVDKAVLLPGLRVGGEFSVSLIVTDEDNHLNSMRALQQTMHVTDHYTVDPLGIPSAPFSGSLGGPGPIIPAAPSRREIDSAAADTKTYFDDVHESFDLTLTTLSLGPTVSFERNRFQGTFGLGFALNIASWDADKTDTLYVKSNGHTSTLARWHDSASGTDVLPGLYLQSSVSFAITSKWSVQAFGRYDWSKELEGSVGGSHFQLDMSGWSVGGAVVYRF